jgi:hypothetical protein
MGSSAPVLLPSFVKMRYDFNRVPDVLFEVANALTVVLRERRRSSHFLFPAPSPEEMYFGAIEKILKEQPTVLTTMPFFYTLGFLAPLFPGIAACLESAKGNNLIVAKDLPNFV